MNIDVGVMLVFGDYFDCFVCDIYVVFGYEDVGCGFECY